MDFKFNDVFKKSSLALIKACDDNTEMPFCVWNLKGSRGSGKTGHIIRLLILFGIMRKVKIYGFRLLASELDKTLIADFKNIFKNMNIPYSWRASTKVISFGKGSEINFFGLKKNKSDRINLTGLASEEYIYDYGFILKDEITEYSISESQAVSEAIRGYEKNKLIDIRIWNPVNPLHWCNKHFKKYLPEDESLMKNKGYSEKIVTTIESGKKEWFSQSNYEVNKFIDPNLKNILDKLKISDPLRAKTMAWGLDGVDEGTLFMDPKFLKINDIWIENTYQFLKAEKKNVGVFTIGLDYGLQNKTAMTLQWIIPTIGIVIVDFYQYNRKIQNWISDEEIVNQIVNKIIGWNKKYPLFFNTGLFYDYSNSTFAEWIKKKLLNNRKIRFEPCEKIPIDFRIKFWKRIFDEGKILINKSNISTQQLQEEFRFAVGKFSKEGLLFDILTEHDGIDSATYGWSKLSVNFLERIFWFAGKKDKRLLI